MPAWLAPALFGLQVAGTIGQGRNTARASRAKIAAAKAQLADNETARKELNIATAQQVEASEVDYLSSFENAGFKSRTLAQELDRNYEAGSGAQGFSFSGQAAEENRLGLEQVNENFTNTRRDILRTLDKTQADIFAFDLKEKARLRAEDTKLKAQIGMASKTNSTMSALGWDII
jgi:hypothetical protein